MTPGARAQAAIELLDEIIAAAKAGGAAADTIIVRYFKTRRYAGSGDRRAIRELVYGAIRRAGDCPVDGRAALVGLARERPELVAAFDGSRHCPAPIGEDEVGAEASIIPQWLDNRVAATLSADELPALLERAPLDLRVNRLKATPEDVLAFLPEARPGAFSPDALRLPEGHPIEASPLYAEGKVEVQDEGSQLIALASRAAPGMTVIDLCAGAGGKTLALAAMMGGEGRLIACDVDRRLMRLGARADRAGVGSLDMRLLDGAREAERLADLAGAADVVLIDAPCSGTGTWRRNPEARWRLTEARLARLTALQARVLELGAPLVRLGGRLVYATCSVLAEEGRDRVAAFLASHAGWTVEELPFTAGKADGAGRLLNPASDGTDGFFVASLIRSC
ncbi:RsmB/NOP family class I SAM-dependent RNA methyltransferase [Sphingomonas naphthae]|uniref:RsmB/NOP family class I SAM-dependent RNA methyltransferase n=1 Tax=Sphingomonas naphthae TaxID=1813468 RepID=A0ABY7TS36_9SPHN|nr:RsmB/NOP family class I SAM-dependent RNA methyltransferase [Sphingomonas naphthae]WCT75220.1 RsmB/NOP family class I SAM-dependent RNA methyltransferase [Sphingomonas naphthae]